MTDPKYIFLDIDMTIWDRDLNIPASTKEAIARTQERGNRVFINTGRSRSNVTDERLMEIPWDGLVCACGGHIEMGGKVLREVTMPYETITKALRLFREHGMPIVIEGRDLHFIDMDEFPDDEYVGFLWDRLGDCARPISALTPDDVVNKFSANISSPEDLAACEAELGDDLAFIDHNGKVVEVIPKGLSKAAGIRWLMEDLSIAPENIYAAGDGMNDYEMIAFATHSIAMGNAVPAIKGIAEYVTAPIDENGIYRAFKHYGLL